MSEVKPLIHSNEEPISNELSARKLAATGQANTNEVNQEVNQNSAEIADIAIEKDIYCDLNMKMNDLGGKAGRVVFTFIATWLQMTGIVDMFAWFVVHMTLRKFFADYLRSVESLKVGLLNKLDQASITLLIPDEGAAGQGMQNSKDEGGVPDSSGEGSATQLSFCRRCCRGLCGCLDYTMDCIMAFPWSSLGLDGRGSPQYGELEGPLTIYLAKALRACLCGVTVFIFLCVLLFAVIYFCLGGFEAAVVLPFLMLLGWGYTIGKKEAWSINDSIEGGEEGRKSCTRQWALEKLSYREALQLGATEPQAFHFFCAVPGEHFAKLFLGKPPSVGGRPLYMFSIVAACVQSLALVAHRDFSWFLHLWFYNPPVGINYVLIPVVRGLVLFIILTNINNMAVETLRLFHDLSQDLVRFDQITRNMHGSCPIHLDLDGDVLLDRNEQAHKVLPTPPAKDAIHAVERNLKTWLTMREHLRCKQMLLQPLLEGFTLLVLSTMFGAVANRITASIFDPWNDGWSSSRATPVLLLLCFCWVGCISYGVATNMAFADHLDVIAQSKLSFLRRVAATEYDVDASQRISSLMATIMDDIQARDDYLKLLGMQLTLTKLLSILTILGGYAAAAAYAWIQPHIDRNELSECIDEMVKVTQDKSLLSGAAFASCMKIWIREPKAPQSLADVSVTMASVSEQLDKMANKLNALNSVPELENDEVHDMSKLKSQLDLLDPEELSTTLDGMAKDLTKLAKNIGLSHRRPRRHHHR